jgi:uncharacterized repeat protein (TIGR01451 family)
MKFMRNLGYLSAILSITALANPAIANQIPTSGTAWTGTGTTAAATKDTPSGLRTTIGITGSGMTMGSRISTTAQTGNTITNPTIPATTNGMQVVVTANASCNNAALICNNLGTITINFTDIAGNPILVKNPVLHMSRLGGALGYTSGGVTANYYLGGVLTLTTPGAVLSSATGNRGFQVTGGNKIAVDYTTFPATAAAGSAIGDCTASPNAPQAGCGSIPVTGLVSSLSFNVDMNRNNTSGNWQSAVNSAWSADGIYFTVSFDEDFGDAPASYDPTTAASHIVSDLALGSAIDVDNPTIINGGSTGATSITPSPNAVAAGVSNNGASGDGADEDAITSFPALASNDTSYALTVPISGASRAGQVCGWIDLNRNNVFDNATERACGSFAIGAATVNLNWTGLSGLTAGNNYVRLRASYDTTGVQNPTGRLSSGEVEDYQITITPANTPVVPPSICSVAGGIRGTNLFANNGTFGTGSLTPATSTQLPPGRTTYTFQNYSSATPNDGGYAIVNQLNQNTFSGSWHNTFGHTTGTVDDQVMLINAAATPGTFYTEILTVPANQNIEFSAWILNLVKVSWSAALPMDPNISFVINRIGVDDNNNGTIDEPGEGQVITNSGLVPKMSTPTWLNYGAIINTGNATQIEYRLVNNAPGGNGNDLLLDDLFAAPCSPMPQGNITGTLYRDLNTNNLYNSGTDTTMPANIAVNLKSATGAIVATAYTDASGNYNFTNVPAGINYTIEVALTDTDIPSGATATANPTGANTTGQQAGITVTNGGTLANQNFGFSAPAGNFINGTCQADGLLWVSGSSGQISHYRVSSQAFTTVSSGTGKVWGDIAWGSDNKLYGATFVASPSLYQIDPATGASTLIASLSPLLRFPNAMSGLPDGSLLIGAASNAKVYRFDLGTPNTPPSLWHDFGAGDPSGDFILFNNKIYVAWRNAGSESLYEVTIDANQNYISHRNLGALPASSWGVALVLNKLYIASNTTIYRVDGIPTDPISTIPVTVVSNTPYPLYGATGMEEPFGGCTPMVPNVLLVKRITAINSAQSSVNGDNLAGYIDSPTNPYDDNIVTIPTQSSPSAPPPDTTKWPNPGTFLLGGINGGQTNPNDTLEYTIYFLSTGDTTAKNVLFCDRVPDDVSFLFNGYGGSSPLGLTGTEKGIELFHNGSTTALSNVPDGDLGQYFPPGVDPKGTYPNVNCRGANTNGAVVVDLGNLPNATAVGTPAASYGFVRFKGSVK